jgi:dienelactone hydrolase
VTRTADRVPGRVRGAAAALAAAATVLIGGCSAVTAASGATTTPSASPARTAPASPTPTPTPTQTARTAAQTVVGRLGTFWTGQHWYVFTEPAHTGPTGERLGPRRLLTQLLYPLAGRRARRPAPGRRPLLVFAPGVMQCGAPYTDMLRSWASAGYVVAIVNFPNSDCKTPAPTESDMVNQPADMSYVITRMLRLSASARGLFAGLLDPREIAVTGQSDGGDTVAAIAANTCCRDRRVRAVAVLSGAEWPPMAGRYFTRRPVPMLFAQGSADSVNFPGCSIQLYRDDPASDRYYLNLFGATHTGPYWGSNGYEHIVVKVTLAFFNRYVLGRASAGPAMAAAGDVGGLSALYAHGDGDLTPSACDN